MPTLRRIAVRAERLIYRIGALPIAFRAALRRRKGDSAATIRRAVARRYWTSSDWTEAIELVATLVLWPMVVLLAIFWFTSKNGPAIVRREQKNLCIQAYEQLRLYFQAGILAPWYYIFSLHDDGFRRAATFLQRCETKWGIYPLLRPVDASPLGKKKAFADRCAANGVRCVPSIHYFDSGSAKIANAEYALPEQDLFVKLARGRGGEGAERWDFVGASTFEGPRGERLTGAALVNRLILRAHRTPILVQARLLPHPAIAGLTAGALPTVRALTCLNEEDEPELVAAVFRMSIGNNRTVDNIHAGGLACSVALETGALGRASNLGSDARLGWHRSHPNTGAQIEGRELPFWEETKALALQGHRSFADRIIVGWDIAILRDGPILIEGNGGPDVDLMQRFMRVGFCEHRLGDLLAWHLERTNAA